MTEPEDTFQLECPYCGAPQDLYVEADVRGTFVEDCDVCCQPWRVTVSVRGRSRSIDLRRDDGSE